MRTLLAFLVGLLVATVVFALTSRIDAHYRMSPSEQCVADGGRLIATPTSWWCNRP